MGNKVKIFQTLKEKILAILEKAQTAAEGEIAEKIELARKAMAGGDSWLDAFTAGYYASWAEGLARRIPYSL